MAKQATRKKATRTKSQSRPAATARRPTSRAGKATPNARTRKRWSQDVTEHSDALDLKHGVFTHDDPKKIAASLKRSAEHSTRRKSDPYRSAMSMLTFYINRGGANLSAARKKKLEKAKDALRHLFGKDRA